MLKSYLQIYFSDMASKNSQATWYYLNIAINISIKVFRLLIVD